MKDELAEGAHALGHRLCSQCHRSAIEWLIGLFDQLEEVAFVSELLRVEFQLRLIFDVKKYDGCSLIDGGNTNGFTRRVTGLHDLYGPR